MQGKTYKHFLIIIAFDINLFCYMQRIIFKTSLMMLLQIFFLDGAEWKKKKKISATLVHVVCETTKHF